MIPGTSFVFTLHSDDWKLQWPLQTFTHNQPEQQVNVTIRDSQSSSDQLGFLPEGSDLKDTDTYPLDIKNFSLTPLIKNANLYYELLLNILKKIGFPLKVR